MAPITSPHPLDKDGTPTHPPRVLFAAAATRVGLIRAGDALDQNLVDFALEVVTLAARVADGYPNPACDDDTVGDAIRAHLYE
jgi:hypothetical protein